MNVDTLLKDLTSAYASMKDPAKKRRGLGFATSLLLLFAVLGLLWSLPYVGAWLTGNWSNSAVAIVLPITGGIIIAFFAIAGGVFIFQRLRFGASFTTPSQSELAQEHPQTALVAALLAPNDELLPHLDYAPEFVSMPPHRERIGALAGLKTSPRAMTYWRWLGLWSYIISLPLIQFQTPIKDIILGHAQNAAAYEAADMLNSHIAFWLTISSFGGFVYFFLSQLGFNGWRIFADAEGIWWRQYRRWVHLPWSDIQSISVCLYEEPSAIAAQYFIIGKEAFIQWELRSTAVGTTKTLFYDPARELVATERLLALAMQRTYLPLRDVGPLAASLSYNVAEVEVADPQRSRKRAVTLPPEPALAQQSIGLIAAVPLPPRAKPNWGGNAIFAVLLCVVCFGPYLFTRYSQATLFPRYLASLPHQLTNKSPLMRDPLTQAAHGWPVHAPDAQDGDRFSFTNGGYTLVNGGGSGSAVLPDVYGAVAIQVTLRIDGTAQSVDTAGAGIVIRQSSATYDDGYDDCELLISNVGRWRNTCGEFSFNASLQTASSYIHQGFGATNTLLVVARGQFTASYVNGHLLGYNYYAYGDPFGYVGLVNRSHDTTATFTDFTLWRINAPPDPSYV